MVRSRNNMNQQEMIDHYRQADVEALSLLYFEKECTAARRNHFENVWHAVGFQASYTKAFSLSRALRALGKPDLACGEPSHGMLGWLIHSAYPHGEDYDWILGFDVHDGVIVTHWSNSIEPDCSPARHMVPYDQSSFANTQIANPTSDGIVAKRAEPSR